MDSSGARLLVERFRSAVTVGRVIIVDRDTPELDLRVGDTGTVRAITDQGWLVAWQKEFAQIRAVRDTVGTHLTVD